MSKVTLSTRRKKGSGEPYEHATQVDPNNPPADAVACLGEIKVTICADEDPYMGGVRAVLEIDSVCDRCGSRFHHHKGESLLNLLTRERDQILTDYIAGLS